MVAKAAATTLSLTAGRTSRRNPRTLAADCIAFVSAFINSVSAVPPNIAIGSAAGTFWCSSSRRFPANFARNLERICGAWSREPEFLLQLPFDRNDCRRINAQRQLEMQARRNVLEILPET